MNFIKVVKFTRAQTILTSTFLSLVIGPQVLSAGERLHLNSGSYQIKEIRKQFAIGESQEKRSLQFKNAKSNQGHSEENYFILQFLNKISLEDQKLLTKTGIEVLRYVPDDAYIVRATVSKLNNLKTMNSNVNDFIPYIGAFKLSSNLQMKSVFDRQQMKWVNVQLFRGVSVDKFIDNNLQSNWQVTEQSDSVIEVLLPFSDIKKLALQPGVEWVSETAQMELFQYRLPEAVQNDEAVVSQANGPMNSLTGYETGTKIMKFDGAWALGNRGEGQFVGVADTGLDKGDRTLLPRDFKNLSHSFVLGIASNTWADYVGHGTHVAGSIVNSGDNTGGVVRGGAYGAQVVVQSLWSQKYKTITAPRDLKVIFRQAYGAGVRVHSNSWGEPGTNGAYNEEAAQVDEFVWENPDMLILFSAGNEGIDENRDGRVDGGSVCAPSTAKNVITVGASENLVLKGGLQKKLGEIGVGEGQPWPVNPLASDKISDNPNGIAAFSSRGPTTDGRVKPELVAPGSNILSNCSKMSGAGDLWGRLNNDYCYSGGTSMSTPLVAAAATVVRQALARKNGKDPSAALIKATLLHSATDLFPGQFGLIGEKAGQELLKPAPNMDEGFGLVNVEAAVANNIRAIDDREGVSTGEQKFFDLPANVDKVTLVYTDAPGSPSTARALVNDLDLLVLADSQTFVSESRVDNHEQVKIPAGQNFSKRRIAVRGQNVPVGVNFKQPFALVYTVK